MQPPNWEWVALAAIIGAVGWTIRTLNRNRAWDKLALNGRETLRHIITILLLVGTTAGTAFTFSNGKLVLSGIWETITSVGGIAAALEFGVVFDGWYIGDIDHRLLTAKGKDKEILQLQRQAAMRWFWIIILFSFTANVIFRYQQTNNGLLAVFVSAAPIALVRLFTIVLRPLPIDYEENARQHGHRALAITTQNAGVILNRLQAKMAGGQTLSESEKQEYGAALLTVGMWQTAKAQDALQQIAGMHGVVVRPAETVDAGAGVYWSTSEIATRYVKSIRWAQMKMKDIPGARRGNNGEQEAPMSAIKRILGDPDAQRALPAPRNRAKRNATTANNNEIQANDNETSAQTSAPLTPTNTPPTQENATGMQSTTAPAIWLPGQV